MPRLVLFSDTHGLHHELPGGIPNGDILIHAGDFCRRGTLSEAREFNTFLGDLPHPHKIVIPGNHDWCAERDPDATRATFTNAIYLLDEVVEVMGLTFYGSPWQPKPKFFTWAFQLAEREALREKWSLIPPDIDALITHGPSLGIGDETWGGVKAGCAELLERVREVKPRLHVFGHIHEARGVFSEPDDAPDTFCVNPSAGRECHPPVVIDLPDKSGRPKLVA
jgi:Icc-related predicted phosphoesterase